MANLIGHYYNQKMGFGTFEIDSLKETEKLYRKTDGIKYNEPNGLYDYWRVLRKDELGKLRQPGFGCYIMYTESNNITDFTQAVIAALKERTQSVGEQYQSAIKALESAEEAAKSYS